METRSSRRCWSGLAAGLAAAILLVPKAVSSSGSLCAVVKLQLSQQAALEREAFSASLSITNAFPTTALQNLKVDIVISTAAGTNAGQLFFVKISSLQNTNDVNGAGTIQANSTATINWLIIPSPGAGGVNPLGQQYGVSANISYIVSGTSTTIQTFDAPITVHPQPLMKLEYAIPFEVFGQEPLLLPNIITPVIPFPLAVRATNVGYGTASSFQIQSAQPVIVDNKQGLNVDFKLIGTHVGNQTIPNTLLIPFGDIAPGTDKQGFWYMTATLSGQFISFTSTFTHAADLGGQLTSLLQGTSTYTLLKDVLVDLPGRDNIPDFLVNETQDRATMQARLDSGVQPPAQFILESDQPNPLPVAEVPGAISGTLGGTSASLKFAFTQPVSSNVWVHSYAPWPYGSRVGLSYAQRNDGKLLNNYNVWISTHFIKSSKTYVYWINILDLTSSTNTYTMQFSPAGLDQPPGAIRDFVAVTSTSSGSLGLTWSAPGEDGYAGYLFGGHYFIDPEFSTSTFLPANASVTFTTSTASGAAQSYSLANLAGNTTYYVAIFTQDTGGGMSDISNIATGYTLPNPPKDLTITSVTATSIVLNWQLGNNSLPIVYQIRLATTPFGPALFSSPFQDSFNRSFTFTSLVPGTTYYVLGVGENPDTSVLSPAVVLGSTQTLPGQRDVLPPRTSLAIGQPQFSSATIYVTGRTSFTLSSVDDALSTGDAAGIGVALQSLSVDGLARSTPTNPSPLIGQVFSSSFTLLSDLDGLHRLGFNALDALGHREAVHIATVAVDNTPPVTSLAFSAPPFIDASSTRTYINGATSIGLAAVDPLSSSGTASGVAFTEFRVDAATTVPFARFASTFTLAEGLHVTEAHSADKLGNQEQTQTFTIRVDTTPPISTLVVSSPQFVLPDGSVLVSAQTNLLIVSTDPISHGVASGVRDNLIAFDTGAFIVTAGTFTVPGPDGIHVLSLFGRDNVLNAGSVKVSTFVLDSIPPTAVLISPSPNAGGVCSVVSGKLPVIGTVADLHFQGYVLDFAPGANATLGFSLIAASTVAVSSGTLGVWDTTSLSGFQTLRLTATDLVDNITVTTMTVFVGSPALLLSLQGRHGFNKPSGVAVDASGRIFVADTNNDQVDVFTSTGGFVTILGRGDGQDGDKDDRTQGRLKLNKPKDVKVDGASNVFIADTNNNRLVKVSLGGQLLLQIGRQHGKEHKDHDDDQDGQEEGQHGQGNGQFNKPSGLALDAAGKVYVSDTNNHRVQIFNADGSFLSTFNLPTVERSEPNDDDDPNDPDSTSLGQPFGITLDAAGNIYVADAHGDRALKFSPQGSLLASFGTSGSGTGQFKRPEGIAVDPDGGCLYVSDRNNNRVQRFDLLGNVTLVFGSSATFNKPIGLALDSAGNLFVADRNNNRVQKFGAPAAVPAPPVIVNVGSVISGLIRARGGGKLERGDKAAVVIPAGALVQDIEVTLSPPIARSDLEENAKTRQSLRDGLVFVSTGVEYGPEGMAFQAPVTIVLPYDPGAIAAQNIRESDLRVHYWNRDKEDWQALSSVVDTANHTVSAQTTHFSLYQIFAPGTPQYINAVNQPFQFIDLYAFPNPSRHGQAVTIRVQPGSADSVDLRIYDISGKLVLATTLTSFVVMDDGNDKGPQITFDYNWDVGNVGSGVYRFAVTAKKTGFSPVHRTGKVGVIR